jgi:Zn-dependent protease with chaperone function
MIKINSLRHSKEKRYFTIMAMVSVMCWLIPILTFVAIFVLIGIAIILWLLGLYFKAVIYGDCVKVTDKQYPEIHRIIIEHCQKLNLKKIPEVFVCNSDGLVGAVAIRFVAKKYIVLLSNLVDLMLANNNLDQLSMIIGSQLGAHAAGHTNPWKNLFLMPATFIPFLGAAYARACVLTQDRVGYVLTENISACQNALIALAHGSATLLQKSNIDEFISQENEIPSLMGFIYKIFSTRPRLTKRVIEITKFDIKMQNNYR